MEILRCSVEDAVSDQLSNEAKEAVLRAITLMGKVQ
jgi:hypothetical protein